MVPKSRIRGGEAPLGGPYLPKKLCAPLVGEWPRRDCQKGGVGV